MDTLLEPRARWHRPWMGLFLLLLSPVVTHGLAAVLRSSGRGEPTLAATALSLAALALGALAAWVWPRRFAGGILAAVGSLLAALIEALRPGAGLAGLALVLAGPLLVIAARWLAPRLPAVEAPLHAHRLGNAAWILLGCIAVLQLARLTTFMTDPSVHFCQGTHHPFYFQHQCLPAYLYGAELNQRGEGNLYRDEHYPGLNPHCEPATKVAGMVPEDPYQYPPPFLLLPRLALALSNHYDTIRVVWFAINVTLFLGVATLLGIWIGGASGAAALSFLPAILAAFPTLYNFQFGQFHLAALALAVASLVAFDRRRRALGGTLLASAILAKLFPVVLVAVLAGQRRWRDLTATLAAGAVLSLLALVVLGPEPFRAFYDYQMPRLQDGRAFAFDEAWPELSDLVIADNQGIFGLVMKLGFFGVPGISKAVAAAIARGFAWLVLAGAGLLATRFRRAPRRLQAAGWMATLALASLASNGAWGDYVPVAAVWLLTLLLGMAPLQRRDLALLIPCALFQGLLLGTAPIGEWFIAPVWIATAAVGSLLLLALPAVTLGYVLRPRELGDERRAVAAFSSSRGLVLDRRDRAEAARLSAGSTSSP